MEKATREAKVHTSWINPNEEYDDALRGLRRGGLDPTGDSGQNAFLRRLPPLPAAVARFGMLNSLSQTLLKLTCPGVPDVYQGQELWDLSLVDPDNRRPVDYERRRSMLERAGRRRWTTATAPQLAGELLQGWEDGRVKLLPHPDRALRLRRDAPRPLPRRRLPAAAAHAGRAPSTWWRSPAARARRSVVVVAPRLWATLLGSERPAPSGRRTLGRHPARLPPSISRAASATSSTARRTERRPDGGARLALAEPPAATSRWRCSSGSRAECGVRAGGSRPAHRAARSQVLLDALGEVAGDLRAPAISSAPAWRRLTSVRRTVRRATRASLRLTSPRSRPGGAAALAPAGSRSVRVARCPSWPRCPGWRARAADPRRRIAHRPTARRSRPRMRRPIATRASLMSWPRSRAALLEAVLFAAPCAGAFAGRSRASSRPAPAGLRRLALGARRPRSAFPSHGAWRLRCSPSAVDPALRCSPSLAPLSVSDSLRSCSSGRPAAPALAPASGPAPRAAGSCSCSE